MVPPESADPGGPGRPAADLLAQWQAANPFGRTQSLATIADDLAFLDDWEARYRHGIELGRALPELPPPLRADTWLVRGCQSRVWLVPDRDPATGLYWFAADSDALIVRGLVAIVLAACNGRSREAILGWDSTAEFGRLGLLAHLSAARGNGLRAMVERIRQLAGATAGP